MELDFANFVGRPRNPIDRSIVETAVRGRRLLVTGGGGSIGSDFAMAALAGRPEALLLMDSSEHALFESHRRIVSHAKHLGTQVIPIVASISDQILLDHSLRQHRPELIVHAAAYKHVSLMEQNSASAMANNAVGTYRLITCALQNGIGQVVMVSTDKAVNPRSIMGASKRIAELVLLSHSTSEVRMNSIRLGNVLGSSGSVVPLFQEQAERESPLTVTHPDARRNFMTPAEAVNSLLRATMCTLSGKVLLADCETSLRVLDLAHYIAATYRTHVTQGPVIEFTGLRAGEKLEEEFLSKEETMQPERVAGLRFIASPCPPAQKIADAIQRIEAAIRRAKEEEMMLVVADLVPGYCGNLAAARPIQYVEAE